MGSGMVVSAENAGKRRSLGRGQKTILAKPPVAPRHYQVNKKKEHGVPFIRNRFIIVFF